MMPVLIAAMVAGLVAGAGTVFLLPVLWTLLIPWPGHEIFYAVVFVLDSFWGVVVSVRSMGA